MRRRGPLAVGVIALVVAALAALNGVVDPKDEFYSGDPLSAALASRCLLAYDVVSERSYPELKRDLFSRKQPTRVVFSSDGLARPGLDLGFPGFGPGDVLAMIRHLFEAVPDARRLRIAIVTEPSWFDPETTGTHSDTSALSRLAYLLSPSTLGSTLDLMRRSRTLAFTGWQKERVGRRCVVDRGSPRPAFRLDGTFSAPAPQLPASRAFAWNRLSSLDDALALAARRSWRVAGVSTLAGSTVYRRELKALFAKHGYRWRVRTIAA
jgi:hypothetical protein